MQNRLELRVQQTLGTSMMSIDINTFPGGELNIRIPPGFVKRTRYDAEAITIEAHIANSTGVIALVMLKNAIDLAYTDTEHLDFLEMAYIPYARQDRVCNPGEAFSLKTFCGLVNNLNFDTVYVSDPHSDVAPALIDNCKITSLSDVIRNRGSKTFPVLSRFTWVSPDFGATKKIDKLAAELGYMGDIIQGTKHRDLLTGELTGFGYYGGILNRDLLIIDDICDGGGTFIGLAKKLLDEGAKSVSLYVTHGIFSKGVATILDNGIERIYTTNSIIQDHTILDSRVTIIN